MAISELTSLAQKAAKTGSLNQLKRINQAVKESTRGIINTIQNHGEYELVSHFIASFPIDEQYIDEIIDTIQLTNKLNSSEKIGLQYKFISATITHEVFCMQDSLGGVSYADAKKVLLTILKLPRDVDSNVNDTSVAVLCESYLKLRDDAAAMIVSVLCMNPSAISSDSYASFSDLQMWVAQNEILMTRSIESGGISEYNTLGIINSAEKIGMPYLALALNLRSNEPSFEMLMKGVNQYNLKIDSKLKDHFKSYGMTKEIPQNLLETMIAYSIAVENILPEIIQVEKGHNIVTALSNAARMVDSLDCVLDYSSSEAGNGRPGTQAVVDHLMERATGNEDFSVLERSWLKPYAHKNLNYLKHAFSNDLGI